MPIIVPSLADRGFNDLVDELLTRIPAHTPEWTNPRQGDPGRTLVELFAWLVDTILYRANLIPERQRLAFLRLVGAQMRPAIAAGGLVSILFDQDDAKTAASLPMQTIVKGPVNFETRGEVTVFPITAEAYAKRKLTPDEEKTFADVVQGLQQVYALPDKRADASKDQQAAAPYITTPVFPGGAPDPAGFDLIDRTVDGTLWLALLAAKPNLKDDVRTALGAGPTGAQPLLNIGVMPAIQAPALFEEIGARAAIPHQWQISTGREVNGEAEYLNLDVVGGDPTNGLTQRGVVRLAMPAPVNIGALSNNVNVALDAGVGDRPPRLDDPDKDARLVAWIRVRSTTTLQRLSLSWVGINAVDIDQRQTITGRVVAESDGNADQVIALPGQSVEPETLDLQVEEQDRGYVSWVRVDDLATMGREARAYSLDSEAGTVRFGDGVRGRIPEAGRRIRVGTMRAGGGLGGNLPPGSLKDVSGAPAGVKLKVLQMLPATGGDDPETLDVAERRVPAVFRHRNRAVTADDYRQLAAETPGVQLGRVEVMPLFKPQQRRFNVPGVVSVVALPFKAAIAPPNPRPDRPLLESVHAYLSSRRPITAELYVIGCEYLGLGVSVAVTVRDGFGRDATLQAVRDTLRGFLWPLPPGGTDGTGWKLGRAVRDRELEVMVARVPGVDTVAPVNLFRVVNGNYQLIVRLGAPDAAVELPLEGWQLPELLKVVVVEGDTSPTDLAGTPARPGGIAIPLAPEVC